MPKSNKWAVMSLTFAILAAPALADGKDTGQPVAGPAPLKPHASTCAPELQGDAHCAPQKVYRRQVQHAPRQVQRRVVQQVATAPSYDFSGFSGGVGAGVDGGYYGGGGGVIAFSSDRRFSGVLQNPASAFTFRRSSRFGGKSHPMPCKGCGGMGKLH